MSSIVERYREWASGSERYHEFKRRAVSKGSEQLVLLVEQKEEGWERKERKRREAEERRGSADVERGQGVDAATENIRERL